MGETLGTFDYADVSPKQAEDMDRIREKAEELEALFNEVVSSQERSDASRLMNIARTNLEQSVMWAIKSVSRR